MSKSNVIPFRKPPPSRNELEIYRTMTRTWSPQVRQLMFPEHFEHEAQERRDASQNSRDGSGPT